MKALRWYGKKDLRYEDTPEPVVGPGQLKVKIKVAGICGTDLKEYAEGPVMIPEGKTPVLGHEFVGEVVELGKNTTGFKIGDRVTGFCNWYCSECFYCKQGLYNLCSKVTHTGLGEDGCLAGYMVAPSNTFYKLPDSISDDVGALVEPLSVAVHAVRLGKVKLGDRVVIVGDGTIGLSALLAARAAGAGEVFVVAKYKKRGEYARTMGATQVIYATGDPRKEISELTEGLGMDVVIECVGHPETPQLAVDLARKNGVVVLVGVFERSSEFHFGSVVFNQITVVGSPIYVDEAKAVIALLADNRINAAGLITAKVLLEDAVAEGFEELINRKEENLKILISVF